MALWKPFRGKRSDLDAVEKHDGWVYFCIDDASLFFDYVDTDGNLQRKQINAKEAEALLGYSIATVVNNSDAEIPTSQAVQEYVSEALMDKAEEDHTHTIDDITDLSNTLASITTDYNETIIGLSVDGQTVTYIKGDGSTHSFQTQDTNTTYSLATDTVTGLTKLYATTGNAEDGTMTQKAIKTELDKKVGVTTSGDTLVFTI